MRKHSAFGLLITVFALASFFSGCGGAPLMPSIPQPSQFVSQKVVYNINTSSTNGEIHIYDLKSGRDTKIFASTTASIWGFDVNPRTNEIVYSVGRFLDTQIRVMKSDGTNDRLVYNGQGMDTYPVWSPDGTRIALSSSDQVANDIFTIKTNGTGLTRITDDAEINRECDWSPDGTKIAADQTLSSTSNIIIGNSDGSERLTATNTSDADTGPMWSPDGTRIAFTRKNSNRDYYVYILNASTLAEQKVCASCGETLYPFWSPDEKSIAFLEVDMSILKIQVAIMNLSSGNIDYFVPEIEGVDYYPEMIYDWSKDSSKMILLLYDGSKYAFAVNDLNKKTTVALTDFINIYSGSAHFLY